MLCEQTHEIASMACIPPPLNDDSTLTLPLKKIFLPRVTAAAAAKSCFQSGNLLLHFVLINLYVLEFSTARTNGAKKKSIEVLSGRNEIADIWWSTCIGYIYIFSFFYIFYYGMWNGLTCKVWLASHWSVIGWFYVGGISYMDHACSLAVLCMCCVLLPSMKWLRWNNNNSNMQVCSRWGSRGLYHHRNGLG